MTIKQTSVRGFLTGPELLIKVTILDMNALLWNRPQVQSGDLYTYDSHTAMPTPCMTSQYYSMQGLVLGQTIDFSPPAA